MCGQKNKKAGVLGFSNPDKVADFKRVPEITARGMELIKSHYNSDYRVRTVSVRLLEYHAEFASLLAEAMIPKCQGDDAGAWAKYEILKDKMGAHEQAIEMYYDHCLAMNALRARIFAKDSNEYMDLDEDKKKK